MSAQFDQRLNDWFDSVEPKQIPSSILPRVFGEARQTGQLRRPWHRFAAAFDAAWTPRIGISPTLVLIILTALLIIAAALVGAGAGLIRMPLPAEVVHGEVNALIAVQDAFEPVADGQLPQYQIRFIDPQTGEDVFTTPDSVRSCAANFSPDGSQYAFLYQETNQGGVDGLYVAVAPMTADSQPTLLVSNPLQQYFDPSWAPDGSAFVMTHEIEVTNNGDTLGYRELLVVPADGKPARRLTDVDASYPAAWSSSGDWIAFVGSGVDNHPLYIVRPDGTDLQMLKPNGVTSVAWSPVRDELAYTAADSLTASKGMLHVVDLGGKELASFVTGATDAENSAGGPAPKWLPEGSQIALVIGGEIKVFDLTVVPAVGQLAPGNIITAPKPVADAVWSADGHSLVAVTQSFGDTHGDLMELFQDGSAPRQIAHGVQSWCMSASVALDWQRLTK